MSHPLPHDKRELNESWSDFRDPDACYQWFLFPERREGILKQLENWTLSRVEELKERGYPELEIAHIPTYPYVRGELGGGGRYLSAEKSQRGLPGAYRRRLLCPL